MSLAPRSFRALTLSFCGLFLGATMLTGIGTYTATRSTIMAFVDRRIATASAEVVEDIDPSDRAEVLRRLDHLMRARETADLGFVLADSQGRILVRNISFSRALPLGYSTLDRSDQIVGLWEGRALVRRFGDLTLTTIGETEPFDDYYHARIRIYLIGFGSIVLIVLGGVVLLGRLVSNRVGVVRQTAEAIVDGDIRSRVPTAGTDDLFDELSRAFNRMLDRVTGLMATISNISADVAHDLRTPLARLRGSLERLASSAETPERAEEIEGVIAQCDLLLAMFAAILRIAEIEGGDRRAGFAPLDLAELVAEIGGMMEPVVEESGRTLLVDAAGPAPILGDRQLLIQLLINLLENTVRHTPRGTTVRMDVRRAGTGICLEMRDDGPGIPAEQRQAALRRFGRLDKSRHRPGHGLGLPLVEAVARLHHGEMALGDAEPGLVVTILIPAAPSREGSTRAPAGA